MHPYIVLRFLLSFKGTCRRSRAKYARWHNGDDVIVLCTDATSDLARRYDYHELTIQSRFSLAPAGNGLHSSRLMEAVQLGAIPVLA